MSKIIFKVTGQERKVIAGIVGDILGVKPKYTAAPSFSFEIDGWVIDRSGNLKSPEFDAFSDISKVIEGLKLAGLGAEGDLSIVLPADGHTAGTVRNLLNIISSKGSLLKEALGRDNLPVPPGLVEVINSGPVDSFEDFQKLYEYGMEQQLFNTSGGLCLEHLPEELGFSFFNATLDTDKILSYISLAVKLSEYAKVLKYTTAKDKGKKENPKYAMRCFLLRLGFIGSEYKVERRELLASLDGNTAYKSGGRDGNGGSGFGSDEVLDDGFIEPPVNDIGYRVEIHAPDMLEDNIYKPEEQAVAQSA